MDPKEWENEAEVDKKRRQRKKPEHTWANWLLGFLIYAGIMVKAQPWCALFLFQYLDLIFRAYMDFPGHSWLTYDQNFCMRASIQAIHKFMASNHDACLATAG